MEEDSDEEEDKYNKDDKDEVIKVHSSTSRSQRAAQRNKDVK